MGLCRKAFTQIYPIQTISENLRDYITRDPKEISFKFLIDAKLISNKILSLFSRSNLKLDTPFYCIQQQFHCS